MSSNPKLLTWRSKYYSSPYYEDAVNSVKQIYFFTGRMKIKLLDLIKWKIRRSTWEWGCDMRNKALSGLGPERPGSGLNINWHVCLPFSPWKPGKEPASPNPMATQLPFVHSTAATGLLLSLQQPSKVPCLLPETSQVKVETPEKKGLCLLPLTP